MTDKYMQKAILKEVKKKDLPYKNWEQFILAEDEQNIEYWTSFFYNVLELPEDLAQIFSAYTYKNIHPDYEPRRNPIDAYVERTILKRYKKVNDLNLTIKEIVWLNEIPVAIAEMVNVNGWETFCEIALGMKKKKEIALFSSFLDRKQNELKNEEDNKEYPTNKTIENESLKTKTPEKKSHLTENDAQKILDFSLDIIKLAIAYGVKDGDTGEALLLAAKQTELFEHLSNFTDGEISPLKYKG